MALDQALFERTVSSGIATARFYNWDGPAQTVGYFHQFDEGGADESTQSVRRYTGGGVVEHGEDLTFVLNFPPDSTNSAERYRWIHQALVDALVDEGFPARLETASRSSAGGHCFTQPVTSDILDQAGTKICGGAQRRSRGFVIHQGSIRLPESLRAPQAAWIDRLILKLTDRSESISDEEMAHLNARAVILTQERYAHPHWNRRA